MMSPHAVFILKIVFHMGGIKFTDDYHIPGTN